MATDTLPNGDYIVSGAHGWQDLVGHLWHLDADTLATKADRSVAGEMVYAAASPAGDAALVVREDDNTLFFGRYPLDETGFTGPVVESFICNDCFPAWQSPVVSPALDAPVLAVAAELFNEDLVAVYFVDTQAGTVTYEFTQPGETPSLTRGPQGPVLFFLSGQDVLRWKMTWGGDTLEQTEPLDVGPLWHLVTAWSSLEGVDYVGVLQEPLEDQAPPLLFVRWETDGTVTTLATFEDTLYYGIEADMVSDGHTLGVSWGETFGQGRVGAHFLSLGLEEPEVLLGDTLVSPPLSRSSTTHTIWSTVSPHPMGYAVIWAGWNEETHHGVYGKILTCRP